MISNRVFVLGLVVLCSVLAGCVGAPFTTGGLDEADTEASDSGDAGSTVDTGPRSDAGADVDAGPGEDAPSTGVADAGTDAACDGGALYLHHVGLMGVTWRDCTPTGTYDAAQALAACAAYAGATDAGALPNGLPICSLEDDPATEACAHSAVLDTDPAVVWTYAGAGQGTVTGHVAVAGAHSDGSCTTSQDPEWD